MRKLLLVLLGLIFIALFTLIPDMPNMAYPLTPVPPITVTPEPTSTPTTPLIVNSAYPQWLYMDCNWEARVEIGWFNPPPDAPPFTFDDPGLLNVSWYQHLGQYYLSYQGIDERGWHRWWATYPVHVGTARLEAFVRGVDGDMFWAYPEVEYLTCNANLFVPLMMK